MKYTLTALIATVAILVGTLPCSLITVPRHSTPGKKLTMEATVTEWVWSNPHCFLKFDAQEKDGTVRHWTVETSNPPDMVNRGWSRRSFKVGDKVTVVVEPVKSGNPVGRLLTVTLPDGKVLSTGGVASRPGGPRRGAGGGQ